VPFEVVPGVSSALAAPAAAGIPVTHRGLASAFVVVSGHAQAAYAPVLDALAPRSATVVALMGLGARGDIAARLLARGWPAGTPAAIVHGAFTEDQHAWIGTLDALGSAPLPDTGAAGTIVVGEVVSLAETLGAAVPVADEGGFYAVR
jgi:siroheme synthase